jgi:hypothetical protein
VRFEYDSVTHVLLIVAGITAGNATVVTPTTDRVR